MLRLLSLLFLLWAARAQAAPVGQWVWSRADIAPLAAARAVRADLSAAVQVAELRFENGSPTSHLRLSPTSVPGASTVVVRFDDTFHSAWLEPDAQVASQLDPVLRRVLAVVKRTAPHAQQLQLDYDCPTTRLPRWAALLRTLTDNGVLSGWEVWTTSLVAHLRVASFGKLFHGIVAGHVLQVFDTGERADAAMLEEIPLLLQRAALPFYVGVAAFERARPETPNAPHTTHAEFWTALHSVARDPAYRGAWVFAAGQDWSAQARGLP